MPRCHCQRKVVRVLRDNDEMTAENVGGEACSYHRRRIRTENVRDQSVLTDCGDEGP